jgi:hypothetical protein
LRSISVGHRAVLARAAKIAFGVAVVAFGVVFVASRWTKLRAALDAATPGWIVLAVAVAIVGQWAAMAGFRAILAAAGRWLPLLAVARVYFVSQLGKYLPGSVWPVVAVTEMCREWGISRRNAAAAGIVGLVYSIVVGATVGLVLVPIEAAGRTPTLWWLYALVPVAIALLHPRALVPVLNATLRLIRRGPIDLVMRGRPQRHAIGWCLVSWLVLGLHCWLLCVALGAPAWSSLAPAIGGFALAYTAGTLFVIAPAGAGVREAVLALALRGITRDSSSFTHDDILLVVLISRVLLAVLDFAQAGSVLVLTRRSHATREAAGRAAAESAGDPSTPVTG